MLTHTFNSTNLAEGRWSDGRMEIDFHGKGGQPGKSYVYFDVPEQAFRDLTNALSSGQHFATHVRGVYKCEPLTDLQPGA